MMRPILLHAMLLASAVSTAPASAAGCHLQSSAHRIALLELYTSEGCNSCPPADRWLAGLTLPSPESPVVPLAFHVDYWNQLGWTDRFAQPSFSERQREAAARTRSRIVYTPQFVLDGSDWRRWRDAAAWSERVREIRRTPPGAALDLQAGLTGKAIEVRGKVQLVAAPRDSRTAIYVAIFESGLSTPVGAGENAGKMLRHDYAVHHLAGPIAPAADGIASIDLSIPTDAGWRRNRLGIAAFAQDLSTGATLQAVSGSGCL
jgi:hypothetical protein